MSGAVTSSGQALEAASQPPPRLTLDTLRPYIGIFGVLLGSLTSFLGSRVTTFGLADLRGALHAGFDEGAWITTVFGVGQMLIGVGCPYLGAVFGVRRILLAGTMLFFTASLLAPFSPNLNAYLVAGLMAGIGSGTFIPVTVSFIIRSLPARLIVYGLAAYAMNSEFSQNVGAALEGWYVENWSVAWINWQYCVVMPIMAICIWIGVPHERINLRLLVRFDWPGVLYAGIGFGLLYAGLDQGNRLDWVHNGLIDGLLISGGLITAAFILRELFFARNPFLNLRILVRGNLLLLMMLLAGFRFIILSTAYVIPTYLQVVQDFRELQVGPVLLVIALPQFALVVPLGYLLSRFDGRWVLAAGALMIATACIMATNLTVDWATFDFLPSQSLQAIGQCFALTALVVLLVQNINPTDALTIGAMFQFARLFGGEIGTAFMQTFVRIREQLHSNLLGLHVDPLSPLTTDRMLLYQQAVGSHVADAGTATAQATALLSAAVAKQSSVLAYIDGFSIAAIGAIACIFLVAWLQPSPRRG
jgi:MFS transporter, DHA2 family, multidrug resistance protein